MATTFLTRGPAAVDDYLSSTLAKHTAERADAIYTGVPFTRWLLAKNRIKPGDGHSYIGNVRYAKNNTAGWITASGQVSTQLQNNVTQFQFRYRTMADSVSITIEELEQNRNNEHKIFDLLGEREEDAQLALMDRMAIDLFKSAAPTNGLETLQTLVASSGTVGDINGTTNAWWQSTQTASGSVAGQGNKDLTTLHNAIGKSETDTPDVGVTTQTVYEAFEGLARGFNQFDLMTDKNAVDMGLKKGGLKFKGVTLLWDENCNSGNLYLLNTRYLYLAVSRNFTSTDFVRPANQLVKTSLISWMGTLVVSNRARNGRLTGLSA